MRQAILLAATSEPAREQWIAGGVAILFGCLFIWIGWHNVRTQTAEESGKRLMLLKILRKDTLREGKSAVRMGVMRIGIGIAAIIFGIVFIFVGPFLA